MVLGSIPSVLGANFCLHLARALTIFLNLCRFFRTKTIKDLDVCVVVSRAEKTVWKKLKTVTKVLRGKHFKVNELVDLPLVQYTLTMKRSSVFYGSLLVSPVVMLVILTNFMFLVPAESSERLTLGGFRVEYALDRFNAIKQNQK